MNIQFVQFQNILKAGQSNPHKNGAHDLRSNIYRADSLNFCGEIGDKFVAQATQASAMSDTNIKDFVKKEGLSTVGYVPQSKVLDILESAADKLHEYKVNEKQVEDKKNFLSERESKLEEREQALDAREQELADREQDLLNRMSAAGEYFDMERVQIRAEEKKAAQEALSEQAQKLKAMAGDIRATFKIDTPEDITLNSLGEQMVVVGKILQEHRDNINENDIDLRHLVGVMQNKDGEITPDMLNFLRRVIEIREGIGDALPVIIAVVKDADGNLDLSQSAQFLADWAWNTGTWDIIENLRKTLSPSQVAIFDSEMKDLISGRVEDYRLACSEHEDGLLHIESTSREESFKVRSAKLNHPIFFNYIGSINAESVQFDKSAPIRSIGNLKEICANVYQTEGIKDFDKVNVTGVVERY